MTVVVATFGDGDWADLAAERAVPSASALGVEVIHTHAGTLAAARNDALTRVRTEWVVHLDADDELAPGYVAAMGGEARGRDVLVPRVECVRGGEAEAPAFPRVVGHGHSGDCRADCLDDGNWIVVGAAVRAHLVRQVGGWREWPIYEDWDLWLRCYRAGAVIRRCEGAVYRAHVRPRSRNMGLSPRERRRVHVAIAGGGTP